MSTSATPPSATPSVPPQGLPFPLPTSATASILTNANTSTTTASKQTAPPLPPPQTFDILPPLHALLSRLEPSLNSYTTDPIATHNASQPSTTVSFDTSTQQTSTQPTQSSQPATSTQGGGNNNNTLAPTTSHTQTELSYKEVVTATQPLKAKMRKALAELGKLGDMHRLPAEQEEEIRELEARIEGQRAVLGRLGTLAGVAAAEGGSP